MTQPMQLALGKGPVRHDERTLMLANYLDTAALPAPPRSRDWLSCCHSWPMYGNDRIGDCVPAGAAHLIQAWTGADGGPGTPVVTDEQVIAAYSAIAGYDPATGANDDGCVMLDALNFWRREGIGGHRITAFVKLNHHDRGQVKQAVDIFGGVYVGAALPLAARAQIRGGVWRSSSAANAEPGSWGGHCIHVGRYTGQRLTCTTWGRTLDMTWPWWETYVDEAYAIVSTEWLGPDNRTPEGLNLDALLGDLRQITGG